MTLILLVMHQVTMGTMMMILYSSRAPREGVNPDTCITLLASFAAITP